ncbi:MAG: hypothetical protein RIR70_655, partial [Pseudomonadota bacterium]
MRAWREGRFVFLLKRPGLAHLSIAVLISAALMGLAAYSILIERQRYDERAQITARNTASLLESSIGEALEKSDLGLMMAAAYFEDQSAKGSLDGASFEVLLARIASLQPELENLRMIDAQGFARYGQGIPKDKPVSFADRAYFQFARDHPEAGLVVSRPTLGRITGKWSIALSRRVNGPDGRFAGIVSAIWSTRSFAKFMQGLELGAKGQASLRYADSSLMYRFPEPANLDQLMGGERGSPLFRESVERGVSQADFVGRDEEGVERIGTWQRVRGFPLVVVVGVARQDYLPEWRRSSGALALISLTVVILIALASRRLYRASARLAESEARWHFALEGSDQGVWDWDIVAGKSYFSPRYKKMLGYEEHEMGEADTEWSSRVHPDDFPTVREKIAQHFAARTAFCPADFRMRHKDGRYIWIASRGMLIERTSDGRPRRMIGTITDITERRDMEDELHALNLHLEARVAERTAALDRALLRLQLATGAGALGIWVWDFASDTLDWDERIRAWYEVPQQGDAPALLYDIWLGRLHPEDRPRVEGAAERARQTGQPFNEVFRIVLPGDRVRYIHSAGVMERDEKGGPRGMVGVNQDVTQQYTLEASLIAAKEAAEAANLTESRFLANMSHEIRTPLNAMIGLASVMQETALSDSQLEKLRKIQLAGQSLLGLLNDILDHSKIEAGLMEIEVAPLDLGQLVERCGSLFSQQAEAKSLRLEWAISPDVPTVLSGDALRLQQVINNLLGNAIKFTERGGVTLAVTCMEKTSSAALIKITVSDTGVGLDADQMKRLFLPFSQADPSITRRYGGSGLGLS